MSSYRVTMEARPMGSNKPWRRVGRHRKTGRFYWYGTDYATALRHRGMLAGSIHNGHIYDFQEWAHKKRLVVRARPLESRRTSFVRLCNSEVGVHESPLGSNRGPRVDWYRKATTLWASAQYGWPWCCAFVVRMALEAGYDLPMSMRTASVAKFVAEAHKLGLVVERAPREGDVLELIGPGVHIGTMHVEGNTTADGQYGSQYEGTMVAWKNRKRGEVVTIIDLDRLP